MLCLYLKTAAAIISAGFVTLFCATAACDQPEQGTGRTAEIRCPIDGLCWAPVGKHSIEGGFRRGHKELKFDIIFSPMMSFETQFQNEWSMRIIDWDGNVFIMAESSNPPPAWRARERDPEITKKRLSVSDDHIEERLRMMDEMSSSAYRTPINPQHLREPWSRFVTLLHMAENMGTPRQAAASGLHAASDLMRAVHVKPSADVKEDLVHGLAIEIPQPGENDAEERVMSSVFTLKNDWSSLWVGY